MFGYKSAWLAILSDSCHEVAAALSLHNVTRVTTEAGVNAIQAADEVFAAGEARIGSTPVFVLPPVDGWVLAATALQLADPVAFDLASLSERFGESQRYVTHRAIDWHEWERWVAGEPMRRYGWHGESGEIAFNVGEMTELEEGLLQDVNHEWDEWQLPDEERALQIASAWSVDPTALDAFGDLDVTGVLGWANERRA